jgi:lactam utilization protein B
MKKLVLITMDQHVQAVLSLMKQGSIAALNIAASAVEMDAICCRGGNSIVVGVHSSIPATTASLRAYFMSLRIQVSRI